jgi:hypothetical protein
MLRIDDIQNKQLIKDREQMLKATPDIIEVEHLI